MNNYSISYTYTLIGCSGISGIIGNGSIVGIDGSERKYILSGLEEYSDFTINIIALNEAGQSSMASVSTTTNKAGN